MQDTKEKSVNRISYLTAAVFMTAFICILAMFVLFTDTVYGDENAVLKVVNGSKTVEFYLTGDGKTEDIRLYTKDSSGNKNFVPNYENGKRLKYSSINDVGTVSIPDEAEAYGPELKEILKAAGVDISKLKGKSITFNGDGYKKTLNWTELITKRYFCPNATSNSGKAVSDDPDKTIVPVMIDFNKYYKTNGKLDNGGTLRIGQASPNDHNEPLFVKYMACAKGTAEAPVTGIIKINDKSTGAWKNDVEPINDSVVDPGEELDFAFGSQTDRDLGIGHGYVYYTMDGSEPNLLSAIYNWNPKFETEFTGPSVPLGCSEVTVKTKIMGLGRNESPVKTFKYSVAEHVTVIDETANADNKTSFTKKQLLDLAKEEAGGSLNSYNYSAYNHMDNYDENKDIKGVTVEKLLQEAGVDVDSLDGDTRVKFTGYDGFSKILTAEQLFKEKRYYFPNGSEGTGLGRKGSPAALDNKVETPAIIGFDDYEDDNFGDATFAVAQVTPNEKNKPVFVQNLLYGTITILAEPAVKSTQIQSITENVYVGNEVKFDIPANEYDSLIYYTIDGSDPVINGHIYNYDNFYRDDVRTYGPSFAEPGEYTLKIVVKHHGKLDSDVKEFKINAQDIGRTTGISAKLSAYNTVTVSGYKTAGANNYIIYYKASTDSSWKTYKTAKTSASIKCSPGKTYSFKVLPYAETRDIEAIYGDYSKTVAIKTLKQVKLTAKNIKKKAVKLSWTKDVGCSGYRVYRALGSGKYKSVKTLSAKNTSWTNKKLKKGKTYKFKIKSYKNEDGKKVYAPYSAVKTVKIKK